MTPKRIGAHEARIQFSDLIDSVHYGGQPAIIERSGRPMVAVIPVDVYQQLVAEQRPTEAIAAVRPGDNPPPLD